MILIIIIYVFNSILKLIEKVNKGLDSIYDTLDKITLTHVNKTSKDTFKIMKYSEVCQDKLHDIYKLLNNLQADNDNKHNHICDKLARVILNTNTVKECVELISNNADKLVKSLEANNSHTQHKTYKSSTKKKKEEKEANNS